MKEKGLWTLILVGILMSVFLSGCVALGREDEVEYLRAENKDLKAEIGLLKKEIADLKAEITSLHKENLALREKLVALSPPRKTGEVIVEEVFEIQGCRVTLTSYEISGRGGIRFNFRIENLLDQPGEFYFLDIIGGEPYILDNQGNQYTDSQISPEKPLLIPPDMPIKGHISFTDSGLKKAGAVTFYFRFSIHNQQTGKRIYSDLLYFGPIKLK